MSILVVPSVGGIAIWLWRRFIKKDKRVNFLDEYHGLSWRHWLVGYIVVFIILVFALFVFVPLDDWLRERELYRPLP
jgi:uncharacterized BrkB/YihY/UPF0761 family membrane protein